MERREEREKLNILSLHIKSFLFVIKNIFYDQSKTLFFNSLF